MWATFVGNNKGKENGNNNLILQASLSLWETGFTWQSTQLDLEANEYQCGLKGKDIES